MDIIPVCLQTGEVAYMRDFDTGRLIVVKYMNGYSKYSYNPPGSRLHFFDRNTFDGIVHNLRLTAVEPSALQNNTLGVIPDKDKTLAELARLSPPTAVLPIAYDNGVPYVVITTDVAGTSMLPIQNTVALCNMRALEPPTSQIRSFKSSRPGDIEDAARTVEQMTQYKDLSTMCAQRSSGSYYSQELRDLLGRCEGYLPSVHRYDGSFIGHGSVFNRNQIGSVPPPPLSLVAPRQINRNPKNSEREQLLSQLNYSQIDHHDQINRSRSPYSGFTSQHSTLGGGFRPW